MHVDHWLPRAAARRPDRIAVATPEAQVTYAELLERAGAAAAALDPGARVALEDPPGIDFAVALHACLLSGAIAVPIDPRLAEGERAALVSHTVPYPGEPPVLMPGVGARGRGPRPDASDAALVVHTSGTTGAPQPVTLTHGNLLASALASAAALGLAEDERWLCPLPLSHVGGLMVLIRSVIYATTAVLLPPPFDARAAAASDVTLMSLVPTQLGRILDAGAAPPPRLRAVLLGGAGAPRSLLERAAAAGWPVRATYGLTQACSSVTVAEPGDVETSGLPLPGARVRIAADGEIVVQGPTVAGGGSLRTGDLGALDAVGRLRVLGRKVDTIVTGGENVAPAEVEAVLVAHPAVADAAVVGRPDPEWGEAVTALVVLAGGAHFDELRLQAFCGERLARFKVPKRIEVVEALPRTSSGKLLRREL